MAEHYRFFDSKLGDERFYTADEFSEYFRTVLTNGIYNGGTNLQVYSLGLDMSVQIQAGYALINGYLYKVDEGEKTLAIDAAHKDFDRIDRIVIRWDKRDESRYIKAFVLKGVAAETPKAPALTRNDSVYELSLAQIRVKAARSVLQPELIVDERLNTSLCGIMNSRIQADTTEIFRQFNDWFNAKTPEFENKFNEWLVSLRDKTSDEGLANHIVDTTKHIPFAAATNSGNAYKVQLDDVAAYSDGLGISFVAPANSTGNATLSVNSLAAVPIIKANGGAVNNLKANGVYTVRYYKGNFTLQGEGGEYGNANKDQVLSGVTIGTENGLVTGTMPNRSAEAFHQLSTAVSAVAGDKVYLKPPNGYYDGESWVYSLQPDLRPENMIAGKSVFGIAGNIPNIGSYVNATSTAKWPDGGLATYFPKGYYHGGVNGGSEVKTTPAQLQAAEPNLHPSNIISGRSIFGIGGTATAASLGGKKMATGRLPKMSESSSYRHTITGLNFMPTHVIWYVPSDDVTQQIVGGVGFAQASGGIKTPDAHSSDKNGVYFYYATGAYGGGGYEVNNAGNGVKFSYGTISNIPIETIQPGLLPTLVWIALGD